MSTPIRILAVAGSLRQQSFNRALLRVAIDGAGQGVEVTSFERLAELPFYDGDIEAAGDPPAVRALRDAVIAADAILLVTPEYNDGTSGVLKNAIDWVSRPPARALAGKLVAVMGASVTPGGARGAIESVKRSLRRAGAEPIDAELGVPGVHHHFDEDLNLTDEAMRAQVAGLMAALAQHVRATAEERIAA
jgi:chromate reductase